MQSLNPLAPEPSFLLPRTSPVKRSWEGVIKKTWRPEKVALWLGAGAAALGSFLGGLSFQPS